MFFIGIFGVENKEKEIKDINNVTCKNCGRMTVYKLVKSYNEFHFFFIPIIKWNTKYYVIARCCNSVYEIPAEKGRKIEDGISVPIYDGDMIPIYVYDNSKESHCPFCRKEVDKTFQFCPHCGGKIR